MTILELGNKLAVAASKYGNLDVQVVTGADGSHPQVGNVHSIVAVEGVLYIINIDDDCVD